MVPAFQDFPKIARLSRDIVVTEKIDGTNGVIYIEPDGYTIYAGSRSRWVLPGKGSDNFGFAGWVQYHQAALTLLGPGYHHGEWWGLGIQRGYGLTERRFSLFNPKYHEQAELARQQGCALYTVPVLYTGVFDTELIGGLVKALAISGSQAAPGFLNPEGIVIYHTASRTLFKKTIEKDEAPKGVSP